MSRLEGRTALVTGAGKGIGAACARALAEAGSRVGILDSDREAATAVSAGLGDSTLPLPADVRSYQEVVTAAGLLAEEFGPVDCLVANAGIGEYTSMSDGDPESWRRLLEINVLGVAYAVRAVLGPMKERGSGNIVLMASVAGREAWAGEPIYIASKHALVGLGSSLRKECAEHGIAVTLVEPAIVDTPLVRSTAEGREELARFATLTAADVARAVVYAVEQPVGVGVGEIVLRALGAEI